MRYATLVQGHVLSGIFPQA